MSRPVRLLGSVRVHPTLGGYVAARTYLQYEDSVYPNFSPPDRAGVGLHLGLPLSFRLFGQDVAVASYAQVPVQVPVTGEFRGLSGPYGGGGLRLNF